jgi:glycosyltransferase involved in cell wall biosynthesis
MSNALTTIITGTYNKHEFLPDAAESVLKQTNPNWRWWIVLDDAEDATKEIAYSLEKLDNRITCFEEKSTNLCRDALVNRREAKIRDKYFRMVGTKYLSWLSDDDVLEPCFVEVLTDKIIKEQGHIAFGFLDVVTKIDNEWCYVRNQNCYNDLGLGTSHSPFCIIDGGQFIQTKESFEAINWSFLDNSSPPSLLDAIYMKELANYFRFYKVPIKVYTKRITYLSTYERGAQ